jgi:hypothetical protein
MTKFSLLPTLISWSARPTLLIINTSEGDALSWKLPFSFVETPPFEDFSLTVTLGIGAPVESVTLPLIGLFCAWALIHSINAMTMHNALKSSFLIATLFWLELPNLDRTALQRFLIFDLFLTKIT